MIIGLMLATTAAVSTYALVKHHQKIEQEKEEYNRLLEQKHIREHYASAPSWNSNVTFEYSGRRSPNDRVKETHSTTVVNNYHDDCGSDDGTGAFAGAMLGSMVGNAMSQPVMPVTPVVIEPTPDVVQIPPETDGSSDVTYDGDSSSDDWSNSSNDDPQVNSNDGGSDVTYDGDSSSTNWSSSTNDNYSSSDTSDYSSSYDSGSSFDSGSDSSW